MRILHPASNKGTLERAGEMLEPFSVEPQHMYRALNILAEEFEEIEKACTKTPWRLPAGEPSCSITIVRIFTSRHRKPMA